jgi:hypothetical protein
MHKKIYYLLMTAGSFATVIMLGICVVWILAIAGCSTNYDDNPLLIPPKIIMETDDRGICCTADEEFPSSCDGFLTICEEQ